MRRVSYDISNSAKGTWNEDDGCDEVQGAVPCANRLDADGLVITKRGKPVARVVPYDQEFADLIGSLCDKIEIHGDIMSTGVR